MKTKFTFSLCVAFFMAILPLMAKTYLYTGGTNPWTGKSDGTITQVNATNVSVTLNLIAASEEVWMAAGNYPTTAAIVLHSGILLYGGFVGTENAITDRTCTDLDGNGVVEPWEFNHATTITGTGFSGTLVAYALLNSSAALYTLDGVTFDGHNTSNATGGAIYTNANSIIKNCIIRNIKCTGAASAGIYSNATGGATITSCLIENCVSTGNGGAIYANRKVSVKQCILRNNQALKGGAIFLSTTADGTNTTYLINNVIYNNSATSQGGAIFINGAVADPVNIINNTIVNNFATASNGTGGIIGIQTSTERYYNNVIYNNCEVSTISPVVKNLRTTIATGSVDLQYCAYNGGVLSSGATFTTTGNNATLVIPAFVQPSTTIGYTATMPNDVKTANFNIQANSPLFDAGSSALTGVPVTDFIGTSRPQRTTADIGAYEFYTATTITTPTISWSQDLTTLNYGDSPTLTATSSAIINAAPITYTSSNPAIVSVSNNILSVVGVGNASITAHQAANGYYYAAGDVSQSVTVGPKALTIIGLSGVNKVYDGTNLAAITGTPTYVGLVNGETFTVSGSPSASFINAVADANTSKLITVVGYTAPNSNYSITQPTGLTAYIYPTISTFSKSGSSNWSTASEWDYSPMAATDLVISSGELIVDQNAIVHSITIAPGAKLTLNSNQTLTATAFTIQCDNSSTGTFVDANLTGGLTVTGTTTVNQMLGSARNWYISSPISNATAPSGYTYYKYHEAGDNSNLVPQYTSAYWENIGTTPNLVAGTGYIANLATGSATYTLTGTLNTNVSPLTLTRLGALNSGFNLVGNPYPSYLNIDGLQSNPDLEPTYWVRSYNAGYVFDTYNIPGGMSTGLSGLTVSSKMPPMQAFWLRVKSGSTSASVAFTNAMRTHQDDANNKFRAPNSIATTQQVLRLQVSNGITNDEAVIYTNTSASNQFDVYDSQKMTNGSASIPEIYTLADGEQLVINGLNTIPYEKELPLGFTTGKANTFTIKASQISNFEQGTQIILKDYLDVNNPIITNLSDCSSYSFSSAVTTNNTSRFSLTFKAPSVTTSVNPTNNENIWISTNSNNQLMINGLQNSESDIAIYNSIGQKVVALKVFSASSKVLDIPLASGIYIVSVKNGLKIMTSKLIIR